MRRTSLLSLVVVAISGCGGSGASTAPGGGGGSTATPAGGGGGGADAWSSTGSTIVTVGGAAVTISPGGCLDGGANGVDFRFGAWTTQTGDWVIGIAHHDGSKPEAISGRVGGKLFVLDNDRAATIGGDGKGTFAGTDTLGGNGPLTATFSCK